MSKPTKGQWKLSGLWYLTTSSGTHVTFQGVESDYQKVAGVMMDTGEIDSYSEMQANAKLIVTAPELFASAKLALELCENLLDYYNDNWWHRDGIEDLCHQLRSVIQKIELPAGD